MTMKEDAYENIESENDKKFYRDLSRGSGEGAGKLVFKPALTRVLIVDDKKIDVENTRVEVRERATTKYTSA